MLIIDEYWRKFGKTRHWALLVLAHWLRNTEWRLVVKACFTAFITRISVLACAGIASSLRGREGIAKPRNDALKRYKSKVNIFATSRHVSANPRQMGRWTKKIRQSCNFRWFDGIFSIFKKKMLFFHQFFVK